MSRYRPGTYDIRREGHAISGGAETLLALPKVEMTDGKLFNWDDDRLHVLALLLESVGLDKAVTLAAPELWRESLHAMAEKDSAKYR